MALLEYKKTFLTFSETVVYPTIKDYEGPWYLIENGEHVALITAEISSETKLTVLYNSIKGDFSKSFSYKNHYLTIDDSTSEHLGRLKSDGTVSWKWPGGEMGITWTWRRPNASDYTGNWVAKIEDKVILISCEQFYVKQLICYRRLYGPQLESLYDVDDGTLRLIHDEKWKNDEVGKMGNYGKSINWFTNDKYIRTWERTGNFFPFEMGTYTESI